MIWPQTWSPVLGAKGEVGGEILSGEAMRCDRVGVLARQASGGRRREGQRFLSCVVHLPPACPGVTTHPGTSPRARLPLQAKSGRGRLGPDRRTQSRNPGSSSPHRQF